MSQEIRETAHFFVEGKMTDFYIKCISSFVANNFDVRIWSYEKITFPSATWEDANKILSTDLLNKIKYEHQDYTDAQSSAIAFSDLFRLELLYQEGGWWFDTDVFCLKDELEFKRLRKNKKNSRRNSRQRLFVGFWDFMVG